MGGYENIEILLGSAKFATSPNRNMRMTPFIDGKIQELEEYDRSAIINLPQLYDGERQACSIFRPSFSTKVIFYNAYTGTTNINVAIDSYSDTNTNRSGTITITPQSGYGLQSTNLPVTQTKAGGGVSTPDYSFSIATDSGDGSCSNYTNGDTFPIYTYIYLGSLQSGQTYYNLDGSTFNGYNSTYSDGSVYGSINSNGYFTYYGDCSSDGGGFLTPID